MASVSWEIKENPNWKEALAISKKCGTGEYPATWVLNFINEWNEAVARLRK